MKRGKLLLRVIIVFAMPVCAFFASTLFQKPHTLWAVLLILVAGGLAVWQLILMEYKPFVFEDVRGTLTKRSFKRLIRPATCDAIDGHLRELRGSLGHNPDDEVHLTAHLAVQRRECAECGDGWWLVQVVDYLGDRSRGRRRAIPAYKGIIGRCLRTRRPESVNFATASDFNERMVREFGFSGGEVNFHDTDARSYLCEPIGEEGSLMGVLYLYAVTPDIFPNNAAAYTKRARLKTACADIALALVNDRRARRAAGTYH